MYDAVRADFYGSTVVSYQDDQRYARLRGSCLQTHLHPVCDRIMLSRAAADHDICQIAVGRIGRCLSLGAYVDIPYSRVGRLPFDAPSMGIAALRPDPEMVSHLRYVCRYSVRYGQRHTRRRAQQQRDAAQYNF